MNLWEFVIAVVFLALLFGLLKQRMELRDRRECSDADPRETEENVRLRQQVKQLQDRIHVLERIVTDRGVETAAQIEALRERDQLGVEDKA
jgi:uncharacterized protein YlxW (UPF0749 family)